MKGIFGVSVSRRRRRSSPARETSDLVSLTKTGRCVTSELVTAPPGESDRIFVVEQTGAIRIVRDGTVLPTPFLDLRDKVRFSSEPGLLSIAFAPDYETSGLFYVFYNSTAGNGDIHISEFRRTQSDPDLADPYSERILLTIVKPWENHNGGMLQFGPDGYLYASVGDGDSGVVDPRASSPRRGTTSSATSSALIRAARPYGVPSDNPFVGVDGVRPEIWAYGLRNPWRFWIDSATGNMFVGDAGEGAREELDLIPKGTSGQNFGWPCLEGTVPFDATVQCANPVSPLGDIPHSPQVCAVIGGVVAHDPRLPALDGRYLYTDSCGGQLTVAQMDGTTVTHTTDLGLAVPEVTSFGVDGGHRIYVTALDGGVYRLDPR
jgi:glucose/arabinose dehydrogenase